MSDFQFYPTPASLATKMWTKFKNRNFTRILETSAGNGDLLKGMPYFTERGARRSDPVPIDCCEIDLNKHATLRALPGVNVVGTDYLQFGGGSIYGHVIQNPPFANGVQFVLRAWNSMFDGEIVSIVNAQTIRNPNSCERQHLVRLIEQHGNVEFIETAFVGEGVERETLVEIALIYLRKQSEVGEDIVGSLIGDMSSEDASVKAERLAAGYQDANELTIPTSTVDNFVLVFGAAVKSMRDAVIAEARATHYSAMIGATMAELSSEAKIQASARSSTTWVQSELTTRYLVLKDKAWANLLRSSNVRSQLSSAAQKRMESIFNEIKTLEFTTKNICGFLLGLSENHAGIMREMACDVFDLITRFHSENVVYYKGWVSNSKQRTCGMRLKKSRFVIPGNLSWAGASSLSGEAERRLSDLDRVLAMLDGKDKPEVSLVDVFRTHMGELRRGVRVVSSYLDVRFYPGAGTIHFFPRSQEIMDRLNLMVGSHRQWLPPASETPSEDFMRQYNDADRFDKELRVEIELGLPGLPYNRSDCDHPTRQIFREDTKDAATAAINAALTRVHERRGISVDSQLQHRAAAEPQEMLLLAA